MFFLYFCTPFCGLPCPLSLTFLVTWETHRNTTSWDVKCLTSFLPEPFSFQVSSMSKFARSKISLRTRLRAIFLRTRTVKTVGSAWELGRSKGWELSIMNSGTGIWPGIRCRKRHGKYLIFGISQLKNTLNTSKHKKKMKCIEFYVIFVISQSAGASVDQFLCHQRETAFATGQNSGDHCSHFMTALFHFGTPVRGPWMIKWEDYSQMIEDQIPVRLAIVKWWKNDENVCPFNKTMPSFTQSRTEGRVQNNGTDAPILRNQRDSQHLPIALGYIKDFFFCCNSPCLPKLVILPLVFIISSTSVQHNSRYGLWFLFAIGLFLYPLVICHTAMENGP